MGVSIIAEQYLHRIKDFSGPHTSPPERTLGVHKELGEDTSGTADPKR